MPDLKHFDAAGTETQLLFAARHGWRRLAKGETTLWFKGYLCGDSVEMVLARAVGCEDISDDDVLIGWLQSLDGHFALALQRPGRVVVAVDRCRTIPVAYARGTIGWVVGAASSDVRRVAEIDDTSVNSLPALALAMGGFTIGNDTLHEGLYQLGPGQAIVIANNEPSPRHLRYHTWQPWRVVGASPDALERRLRDITLAVLEKQVASLDGRPVALPLSAGFDSRLVASGLRHLGVRDVFCFSYGHAGGHEANTARQVAQRLGYPWRFAPTGIVRHRRFFADPQWSELERYSEDSTAIPFVQDIAAIVDLRTQGYLPHDCVFINGNSGDFISGLHIVPELRTVASNIDPQARQRRITSNLIKKHFSLWQHLMTDDNLAAVGTRLWQSITSAGADLGDPATDHGLYEFGEFVDRQSKYVIKGQRTYEFLGYDWRLPLWDNDYLDFWESVPLEEKAGQTLYARMLHNANWGGVWNDLPLNRRRIRPRWLLPIRQAAKAMSAPLGRERWHRIDDRFFRYWMASLGTEAYVPYRQVLRDRRGARNVMAWLAEAHLACFGVALDELR